MGGQREATTSRTRQASVAALVVCALWAAVLAPTMVRARQSLDSSAADLVAATDAESATRAHVDEQASTLESLTEDLELLNRTLGILQSGAERTAGERDAAQAQLDLLVPQVEAAASQLGQTEQLAEHQVLASMNIHQCTEGTVDALATLALTSRAASIDKLRLVADACRNAQMALADGQRDLGFPWDFPDPSVLVTGDSYVAFATNSVGGHVQAIASPDLAGWTWVGEALPTLPDWAEPGQTWAPAALHVGDKYALYFSARERGSAFKCIGVAFSEKPGGPYGFSPPEPVVCQHDEMGSIDPKPFVNADGKPYLVWKSDGDFRRDGPAKLWSAPLSDDGAHLAFYPSELLASDRADEDHTIEGPNLVQIQDQWILLYSSNRWDTGDYRMDYAVCDSAAGPCRKPPDNTILSSYDNVKGPGGGEVFQDRDGSLRLTYHAWIDPDVGFPNNRYLHIDRFRLDERGRPVIER